MISILYRVDKDSWSDGLPDNLFGLLSQSTEYFWAGLAEVDEGVFLYFPVLRIYENFVVHQIITNLEPWTVMDPGNDFHGL